MVTVNDEPSDIKKPLDGSTYRDVPSIDAPPPYTLSGRDAMPSSSSSSAGPSPTRAPIPTSPFSLASAHPASLASRPSQPAPPRKWLSFLPGSSKPTTELLTTIHSLLRDLVQRPTFDTPETFISSILTSCKDACVSHGVNFSEVLQERFIEGHGAVYWAIVTRQRTRMVMRRRETCKAKAEKDSNEMEEETDLVLSLFAEMAPILPHTISEVRRACMVNSDHSTFTLIKSRFPKSFAPLSGSDEILLKHRTHGEEGTGDVIKVEEAVGGGEGGSDEGDKAFVVRFEIVKFQLRMRVSKVVRIEWIARGTHRHPVSFFSIPPSLFLSSFWPSSSLSLRPFPRSSTFNRMYGIPDPHYTSAIRCQVVCGTSASQYQPHPPDLHHPASHSVSQTEVHQPMSIPALRSSLLLHCLSVPLLLIRNLPLPLPR